MPQSPGPQLWRLLPEHAPAAGALLERAFREAPLFRQVVPDPEMRAHFCLALFTRAILYGCRLGEAWAVGSPAGTMAGVAFWIAKPEPAWTAELRAELNFDSLAAAWRPVLDALQTQTEPAEASLADLAGPWRYLDMIGVDPRWQGQGYGGVLVRKFLADAKRSGVPLALITDNPENVPFYLHHGFALHWHGTSPDGSLLLWSFTARS